jgi:hypothetical protein
LRSSKMMRQRRNGERRRAVTQNETTLFLHSRVSVMESRKNVL